MRFIANVHTKDFLLAHPNLLGDLCRKSSDFAQSDLAQDFDILNIEVDGALKYKAAHMLASHQFEWAKTPASQDVGVLSIETPYGTKVAHIIAQHDDLSGWSLTPIAQRKEVLDMPDGMGQRVSQYLATNSKLWAVSEFAQDHSFISIKHAHGNLLAERLASHNNSWLTTPAAQDFRNLELRDRHNQTVALVIMNKHFKTNGKLEETKLWMNSPAAKDKKILLLTDGDGISVAQYMMNFLTGKKQKELMLNLISQGAALKYAPKGQYLTQINMTSKEIIKFANDAEGLILDENEPYIKAKMLIAYYSTLIRLAPCLVHDTAKKTAEDCLRNVEKQLTSMIENQPNIALEFADFSDDNCSPWFEFYRKYNAEKSFNVDIGLQNNIDCDNYARSTSVY